MSAHAHRATPSLPALVPAARLSVEVRVAAEAAARIVAGLRARRSEVASDHDVAVSVLTDVAWGVSYAAAARAPAQARQAAREAAELGAAVGERDGDGLAGVLALGAEQGKTQSARTRLQVLDLDGGEFGPAQRPREADQQAGTNEMRGFDR